MAHIYKLINAETGGGGSGSTTFTQTFDATTDWGSPSGGVYSITVLQATHGKNTEPQVQVFEDVASVFELVGIVTKVNASGDVTIEVTETVDTRFAGKIVIL